MNLITYIKPGEKRLLMGNQAIARGILESGATFASGYPGTPSSEIIETLASVSSITGMYVEWSINEKVALETAAAASFAGQRSVCVMKQNGVNVASDFLLHLAYSGTRGGLILVVCDDPGALSSVNEGESRHFAKMIEIPLLEPSGFQEAKDIIKYGFSLSEELGTIVMIRSVTRLSHASGPVVAGEVVKLKSTPYFHHGGSILDKSKGPVMSTPVAYKHEIMQKRLHAATDFATENALDTYHGPNSPELVIITSSVDYLYSLEAVEELNLGDKTGILKLVSTNPVSEKIIKDTFRKTAKILFVEQVLPFLEESVKTIYAEDYHLKKRIEFFGKKSGHIAKIGETGTDAVISALTGIFDLRLPHPDKDYNNRRTQAALTQVPGREMIFCPGCPHRASFFHLNNALKLDDKDGFICGDIGCYTLGMLPSGFSTLKTVHSMGSGTGIASGFGKLNEKGMSQTIISVCGDSTFFHSGIPPLINAVHNNSNMTMVILDNSGTAMTGFQPHPGEARSASDNFASPVDIASITKSCGARTYESDPFDFKATKKIIPEIISSPGVKVLILKQKCALSPERKNNKNFEMEIDHKKCIAEKCGCSNFCTRIFKCPALYIDKEKQKPQIDPVLCAGCGVCADICFHGAITKKAIKHNEPQ